LKALEDKAIELDPNQQREFENRLRYIITGLNSRLGQVGWNDVSNAEDDRKESPGTIHTLSDIQKMKMVITSPSQKRQSGSSACMSGLTKRI